MAKRLRTTGIVLGILGLVFLGVGGFAFVQVQNGNDSLQAFSEAQNVTVSYNEDGQLIDRGSTETADEIMELLTVEWGYPVNMAELDPNDPVVNTASEYMWQMAVIGYHVLNGAETVVLDEAVEYNGETFAAGEYELFVRTVGERGDLGGYWTDFDRMHPIEGPARSAVWSGTAHGLIAELGVGTVTASTLQMGLGLAGAFAGLGVLALVAGGGLWWASREDDVAVAMTTTEREPVRTG